MQILKNKKQQKSGLTETFLRSFRAFLYNIAFIVVILRIAKSDHKFLTVA